MNTTQNKTDFFLHNSDRGQTIRFQDNQDGTMTLFYQNTLDPNEDLDSDDFPIAEARALWMKYRKGGYKKSQSYHQGKRDWNDGRDE